MVYPLSAFFLLPKLTKGGEALNPTIKSETHQMLNKILVDSSELQALLCCGRHTANKIAKDANARVSVGRRVLYNRAKIESYLNSLSE